MRESHVTQARIKDVESVDLCQSSQHASVSVAVLEGFNAHNEAWQSNLSDDRGAFLAQQVENSIFFVLNTDYQTRHPSNGNPLSPDFSLISAHLALCHLGNMHILKLGSFAHLFNIHRRSTSSPDRKILREFQACKVGIAAIGI
jgi:hypothetical protein